MIRPVMIQSAETKQEEDGRWLAEVLQITSVLAYGSTRQEAIAKAEALALRVLAERPKCPSASTWQ